MVIGSHPVQTWFCVGGNASRQATMDGNWFFSVGSYGAEKYDERARNWRILGSMGLKTPRQLYIVVNNDCLTYFIRPGVMIWASGA